MPASYVADNLRTRHNDKLWKVKGLFGADVYIYCLLEFQSTPDWLMAVRMLGYVSLLWQHLYKTKVLRIGHPLPPVLPIVLYNGKRPWKMPRSIAEMLPPMPLTLMKHQALLDVFLLDEGHCKEPFPEGLVPWLTRFSQPSSNNLVELMEEFLPYLERTGNGELLDAFWALIQISAIRNGKLEQIPSNVSFKEQGNMIREQIDRWKRSERNKGRAEGEAKGIELGTLRTLAENIRAFMQSMSMPMDKVMDALHVKPEERGKIAQMVYSL